MTRLLKFIAFALDPAGRVRRVGFSLGVMGCIIAFLVLGVLWSNVPTTYGLQDILAIFPFTALWIKSVLTSRRLHDLGWTGWLASPGVFACAFAAFARYLPGPYERLYRLIPGTATDIIAWGASIFLLTIGVALLGDLFLGFIPGQKTANRYGPPPGQSTTAVQEVF